MHVADTTNLSRMRQLQGQRAPQSRPAVAVAVSTATPAPLLMRPRDVAKLLGICEKTLKTWGIPRFQFGNVVGYRPEDVNAFLAAHTERPKEVQNG